MGMALHIVDKLCAGSGPAQGDWAVGPWELMRRIPYQLLCGELGNGQRGGLNDNCITVNSFSHERGISSRAIYNGAFLHFFIGGHN